MKRRNLDRSPWTGYIGGGFGVAPKPATSVKLGALQQGSIGDTVPRPSVTANGTYTSISWVSSNDQVITPVTTPSDGIKYVGAGTATLTITLKDASGATLATDSITVTVAAPVPAPAFTTQPDAHSFYQQGGKVEINNAAASNATSYQWQKQNGDGTWGDVATQKSAKLSIPAGQAGNNGVYRLVATNATGSATSDVARLYDVYGFIQNDNNPSGDATSVIPVDHQNYTEDGPAGARQYSLFMRFATDQVLSDGSIVTAEASITTAQRILLGLASARLVATWASSNTAVVANTSVNANGSLTPAGGVKAGTADVVAGWKNIQSTVHVVIP